MDAEEESLEERDEIVVEEVVSGDEEEAFEEPPKKSLLMDLGLSLIEEEEDEGRERSLEEGVEEFLEKRPNQGFDLGF